MRDAGGMAGRAVVTGATSGLGREIAAALCRLGWRVTGLGRDPTGMAGTRAAAGDGYVGAIVDLSDLNAAGRFGSARRDTGKPLDLLVCNAGIMAPPQRMSGANGHELQLTVNHLSHYVLAARLAPVLRLAAAPRIVWVTSVRHHAARQEEAPWDPARYDGAASYATSKAWNLAFSLWLDNRLKVDASELRSVAAHPGWSGTALQRTGPLMDGGTARGRRQARLTGMLAQSAARGAIPILAAALGRLEDRPTHLGPSGPFELWGRRAAPARISALALDEEYQGWVAGKCAELTRTALPA